MTVTTIGNRVAEIDAMLASVQSGVAAGLGRVADPTSFAQALQTAQGATPGATSATATPTGTLTGAASPYDAQIGAAAAKYGIDPALLKGLIRQESNFDPGARSSAGATGLTQLMPGTAATLGVDPSDPAQAIDGGARYLKQQLDRFGGDATKALAAYNAGPGAVAKYGGVPPFAETQGYVQKVLGYAAAYGMGAAPAATTPAALPAATNPVLAAAPSAATNPVLAAALPAATNPVLAAGQPAATNPVLAAALSTGTTPDADTGLDYSTI